MAAVPLSRLAPSRSIRSRPPSLGYNFNIDIANDAISWLHTQRSVAPSRPYLLYFAPGGTHAPHQVPKEWIERFRGKFDQGWDRMREGTFARQKAMGLVPADAVMAPRPDGPARLGLADP